MPIDHPHQVDLDVETFCKLNVRNVGAYKYAQHQSCELLILSYSYNGGDLVTWLPHEDIDPPAELVKLAASDDVLFIAHNAQFERCIWHYAMRRVHPELPPIPLHRWRCSAAMAAAAGLPRSLDGAGAALRLPIQKDKEGSRLIRIFCTPRKPTKYDKRTRVYPWHKPEEFERFVQYNRTDVLAEQQIIEAVPDLLPAEWRGYQLVETMNDRGMPLDMHSVHIGFNVLRQLEADVVQQVTELTGGIRPTQRDKMLEFLNGLGLDLENMQAKTIKDLVTLRGNQLEPDALRLLQLRVEGGKASTKKLTKMIEVACFDDRCHGMLLFYGAHTGRLSGKLIQPHNFIRGEYKPHQLYALFELLQLGDVEAIKIIYEWPIDALAQGMRGYIMAGPGKKFVVCDFSAIEARVLAWLAREMKTIRLYEQNADLYKRLAVRLYNLQDESQVTTPQRKFAKDLYLGSGYQLGWAGFVRNCLERGIVIADDEAKTAIKVYRDDNPAIVQFWYDVEACAIRAVATSASVTNPVQLRNLLFFVEGLWFCIQLPSGRLLRYPYPRVENAVRFGKKVKKLTFRTELKGKWIRESTYGGKLVENIVQAVSYDLMTLACFNAERRGYEVIGTVHDELVTEVPEDFGNPRELEAILRLKPKWATDCPVNAEGWEGRRYRK